MIDDPLDRATPAVRTAIDAALADEARETVAAERAVGRPGPRRDWSKPAAPVLLWNGARNIPRRVRPYFACVHRLRWAWRRLVQRSRARGTGPRKSRRPSASRRLKHKSARRA